MGTTYKALPVCPEVHHLVKVQAAQQGERITHWAERAALDQLRRQGVDTTQAEKAVRERRREAER